MKTGKSLSDLATLIEKQNTAKKDYVAPTSKLQIVPQSRGSFSLEGLNGGNLLTDHFHSQVSARLQIPKPYYDRMREGAPDLLANNVNHWFGAKPERRLIRTLEGNARAFLSDRYRPLDNYDLANAVLPILSDKQLRVESCDLTETKMYIKAVYPRIEREISVGDVVQAGLVISNSEVGNGTLQVSPMIYRLMCKNGAISQDHSMRKFHTGGRQAAGDENDSWTLFSDKTRELSDAAFWNQVRDLTIAALSDVGFDKIVSKLKQAKGTVIENNPVDVVEIVQKKFSMTDEDKNGILKHLATGGDLSVYGLMNAVTRHSQDISDYDKATDFEKIGGQIIELPAKQWEKIVA
jgi:hypothetical protein